VSQGGSKAELARGALPADAHLQYRPDIDGLRAVAVLANLKVIREENPNPAKEQTDEARSLHEIDADGDVIEDVTVEKRNRIVNRALDRYRVRIRRDGGIVSRHDVQVGVRCRRSHRA